MAWIKRNLYFVIALAVGVALIGVAGYFVYGTIGANADASGQYSSALNDLTTLQAKKPFPSKENIQVAKDDADRVAQIVKQLGSAFVNFPAPPTLDPREFITYLNTNLGHFRMEATNANIELASPDYAFSFSSEAHTLSFPESSFAPWMEQLEEIRAIVDILCASKINALDSLQRVPAPGEDPMGADYLQNAAIISNQVAIITPYRIVFRGFSDEIAKVLKGFAQSPHCFLVKNVSVTPSKDVPLGAGSSQTYSPQMMYVPRATNPYRQGGGSRRRGGDGPGGGMPYPQPAQQPEMMAIPMPVAPAGPVTILKPMPLLVTVDLEVVKLKNAPH